MVKEKETIGENMGCVTLEKIVDDLKHEKAELEERIERLEMEKTDIVHQIEITIIIGDSVVPEIITAIDTSTKNCARQNLLKN